MTLKDKIIRDMKAAQKGGDKLKLNVTRLPLSEIKYKEKESGKEAEDQEVIEVLSSAVRRRKESIEKFQMGRRDDLVEKEKAELELIKNYLPPKLSEQELILLIDKTINEVKAEGPKDLGKVMKVLMPEVKGRADEKEVNILVSSRLESTSF